MLARAEFCSSNFSQVIIFIVFAIDGECVGEAPVKICEPEGAERHGPHRGQGDSANDEAPQ